MYNFLKILIKEWKHPLKYLKSEVPHSVAFQWKEQKYSNVTIIACRGGLVVVTDEKRDHPLADEKKKKSKRSEKRSNWLLKKCPQRARRGEQAMWLMDVN